MLCWLAYVDCPLCKQRISHSLLDEHIHPHIKLMEDVKRKALQRLKYEGLDKDPQIIDSTGRYYGNPGAFAIDRFAYYECFKCKNPYFGGMRACEDGAREEDAKVLLLMIMMMMCFAVLFVRGV